MKKQKFFVGYDQGRPGGDHTARVVLERQGEGFRLISIDVVSADKLLTPETKAKLPKVEE